MFLILLLPLLLICLVLAGLWWFTARTAGKVEQALPARGRFVDVPGARLHMIERGQGPAILLIHGLGGQCGHYTYGVTDRLAVDHLVVAVDRPGSGYSTRDEGASASLPAQAAMMAALIDKLQLDRPLVVGHSLGGAIALALATDFPEKVRALALVAPLTSMAEKVSPAFQGLMISRIWVRKLVAWTLATPAMIMGREKMLGLIFGPETVPADYGTHAGGLLSMRPSQFLSAAADLHALPDSLPLLYTRYGELRVPVSVLYGRGDRILDPTENGTAFIERIKATTTASLELIDGGHMLPVTNPVATAAFIRKAAGA